MNFNLQIIWYNKVMGDLSVLDVSDLLDDITGTSPSSVGGEPAAPPSVDSPPTEGHRWALDCYWAYSEMGGRPNKAKAGSPARYALWQMANKDPGTFVTEIMPKAMNLLDKARAKNSDSENIAKAEKKAILKLQELLKSAVEESRYE
jgi:hypothetical protein